ncbi:MAG: mechanosensitive ion channel domain-containing protein [Desulfopila sp.]|jgi:small-conductance mechanosensitive channel|nr:mechanosensitive ion channel domain-containing protein [Desulfopila sp.]
MVTGFTRYGFVIPFLFVAVFLVTAHGRSAEYDSEAVSGGKTPDQINSILAPLSDAQVRNLLIEELAKKNVKEESSQGGSRLYFAVKNWLHILDSEDGRELENNFQELAAYFGKLPDAFAAIYKQLGSGPGAGSAAFNLFFVLMLFLAAFGVELFFRVSAKNYRNSFLHQEIPELHGYTRFMAGILRGTPLLVDLAIFTLAAFLLFLLTPLYDNPAVRYLFLAIMFSLLFFRIGVLLSHLVFSPQLASLRLLPISEKAAQAFHMTVKYVCAYVGTSLGFIALIGELGVARQAVTLSIIVLGSILLIFTAFMLVYYRKPIAEYILSAETVDSGSSWVIRQLALYWHIPALLYLLLVWMLFAFQQTMGMKNDNERFLLSLLVVPLFLLFDRIGHWVVRVTVQTLKIYQSDEQLSEEKGQLEEPTAKQKEKLLTVKTHRVVRLFLLLAFAGWVMSLWGYPLPYLKTVSEIVFRSLVTMALALALWRIISGYIERKILEDEPEEQSEDDDSEWGGSALRGRSYTLLPMVRKFLGTVLVAMVTLTVLSTIGVEIGPLLAGAGVVGLAIGFGAQKLVSDVFSGFFFLLDDAFRVGEYLEAGGVSGKVEGTTLRNVLLRHHRGMLQIVPYSELGSITNYMRGGIVVKFNLEFPYDTDIDLVRRVIKKVGQAMLADEDYGKDFIQPVKSQGVREITNSVMVIRVKFTAKPGTHFVIRREAYRRITEALAAKGIHYAHRKVIVEVPEAVDTQERQRIAEAGAAAGSTAMSQDSSV